MIRSAWLVPSIRSTPPDKLAVRCDAIRVRSSSRSTPGWKEGLRAEIMRGILSITDWLWSDLLKMRRTPDYRQRMATSPERTEHGRTVSAGARGAQTKTVHAPAQEADAPRSWRVPARQPVHVKPAGHLPER